MPAALAADYDAVPGPAAAAPAPKTERPVGLFGRLFGGPIRARRWLAASVPALIVAVVAVALGPQIFSERAALQKTGEGAGTATPKVAADAKARRAPVKDREADLRKRDVSPQPAEAAKPKPEPARRQARRFAEEKKKEASKEAKPGGATLGKNLSVLTTTVVPLSSELREAVVTLGRSQQGAGFAPPAKSEAERRSAGPMRPSTGSSADQAARESRSDKSVSGLLSQGRRGLGGSYIDVINRAVAPDCTKDPAACCGSHQVDQDLLNRLQTSQPPQSVKVLHLSSRACYLTLP